MYGTLEKLKGLSSDFFEVPSVEVWLPEEYDDSKEHPVIYMLDGQWLFDPALTWANQSWEVDKSMSDLIKAGKIPQTIVVGIWHHENSRNTDYLPNKVFSMLPESFQIALTDSGNLKVKSDALLSFIVKELKPYIDTHFSTSRKAGHTIIMGSSMGALFSMYAVCEYPEYFGGAGCLSPHWCLVLDGGDNPAPAAFMEYLHKYLPTSGKPKFYFDMGTAFYDNRNLPYQSKIDGIFKSKCYTDLQWTTKIFEGHSHSEKFWALRFPEVVQFLLD